MNYDTAAGAFIHMSKFKKQKPLLRIEKFVRSAIFVAFRKQSEMIKKVKYISTPSPKNIRFGDTVLPHIYKSKPLQKKLSDSNICFTFVVK